jgi:hypothetical protein
MEETIELARQELDFGAGFDLAKHRDQADARIKKEFGNEWRFSHMEGTVGIAVRTISAYQFIPGGVGKPTLVKLPSDSRIGHAAEFAAWIRVQPEYQGFEVIEFVPAAGYAMVAKMDIDVARCREEVAYVLGVQKWDVGIEVTRDKKGNALKYDLRLPRYTPSKHTDGLLMVAQEIVGHEGWFARTEVLGKTCVLASGPHWGFSSKAILMPTPTPKTANASSLSWGERLNQGDPLTSVASINFIDHPHVLVSGQTRSGKGEMMRSLMAHAIAAGWGLIMVEPVRKGNDFTMFRPFVMPGFWGCSSFAHATATIEKVEDEYQDRMKLFAKFGAAKLTEVPIEHRPNRWLVVIDEYATLTKKNPEIGGKTALLPEEMKFAAKIREMEAAILGNAKAGVVFGVTNLIAKAAAAGIHILIATQRASAQSLGDNDARNNFGTRILLGQGGTIDEGTVKMTISSEGLKGLPKYPKHLLESQEEHDYVHRGEDPPPPGPLKGAGYVAANGTAPYVAKGWFFDPKRLQTEEPWRSLGAKYAKLGYGQEISRAEVSERANIPESLVDALVRGRFTAADMAYIQAADNSDEETPTAPRRKKAPAEDVGKRCSRCNEIVHPVTQECGCPDRD